MALKTVALLRLGPVSNPKDTQIALREVENKVNELIRAHNELLEKLRNAGLDV